MSRPRPFLSSFRLSNRFAFRHLLVENLESRVVFAVDTIDFVGPLPFTAKTSPDQFWSTTPGIPVVEGKASYIHPVSYTPVALDHTKLMESLSQAPLEFTPAAAASAVQVSLPTPDGSFAKFKVVLSPIMEPALAAQFPEIQTYSGQGIDDPAATLRFDVTPAGFHAQVLSPQGAYYIDPYWHLDSSAYVSYYKRDLLRSPDRQFVEEEDSAHNVDSETTALTKGADKAAQDTVQLSKDPGSPTLQRSGTQLKSYRLANAATGEYTAFFGGSVAQGQAAIVTAINRVTGIYENELSVRLVLVNNNSSLVYTSTADPYTNDDGFAMLGENQANVDAIIGTSNYDIGHVFSTGGGGVAGLGVVGKAASKARGVTGSGAPVADAFYVDYVAHEMGHQFGGNHTFNSSTSSCGGGNRNASTAYEPGSGSTIQAYAGICGADNLQPNSDPYFHSVSFDEIIGYISQGPGLTAAVITNTGNSVPRISAGPDHTIPAQTPFALKAAGADSDASDVLTYNWEQRDLGASTTLAAADNGTSPLLRSFNPTLSEERIVPRLSQLLSNSASVGEKLPTLARTMKFRATVRDNRSGGGGVNTDDMVVNVVATGAAFAVTSPNTAVSWSAGSSQTVTWNVAGTTAAPINTASVNIWLSTDGGLTFPIQLASNVANDGSETVTIPNIDTTQARIKVEPTNSIYFDLSNANFTITGGTNTAPTISSLSNRLINMNTSTGSIAFTVGDSQTAAQDLTVTATSPDSTLMPAAGIVVGGSGANRTLTLTPTPGQFGAATIYVNVTDAGGLTTTATFQLYVEAVFACQSIESFDGVTAPNLPAGWTTVATGAAATNWETSATTSDSGPNNAFVPNPLNVSDSQLTSAPFTVTSANRTFQFRNNYNLESGWDGGVLEISVGGGAFSDVTAVGATFQSGGYAATLNTGVNPLAGRSSWTGSSGGYITTVVQLPVAMIGSSVRLRFRMGSDDSLGVVGWRVDTIQYCGLASPSVLSITATSASQNEGNSGTTSFDFTVSRTVDTTSAGTVQYAVTGSGAVPATADDFGGTLPSGTVSFAAGESSKVVSINVTGDTLLERNEGFTVTLSGATGGAVISVGTANGLIIDDDNVGPTDLAISQSSITENSPINTTVGTLSTVDGNAGDTFVYSLIAGSGDTDNSSFTISGNQLRTATALNFETKNNYSIRVRSTDAGGQSFDKSLSISVVDLAELSAPIQFGDGTAQRSTIKNIVLTFDGTVTIAAGAFVVDKLGTGGGTVTSSTASVVNGAGQTVATLSFSGGFTRGTAGALSDGYYRLTIDGTKVTRAGQQLDLNGDGIGGDTLTIGSVEADNFFAQFGDTTGDGLVDVTEFGQFRTSFGKSSTDVGYDVRYDFEDDAAITVSDFGQFRSRFGKPKMTF